METRENLEQEDPELAQVLSHIDNPVTRAAVTAERAVLARLGAGCAAPVGALAVPTVAGVRYRARAGPTSPRPVP